MSQNNAAVRSAGPLSRVLPGENIGRLPGVLPLVPGWTDHRDLPHPQQSFRSWWAEREKQGGSAPPADSDSGSESDSGSDSGTGTESRDEA